MTDRILDKQEWWYLQARQLLSLWAHASLSQAAVADTLMVTLTSPSFLSHPSYCFFPRRLSSIPLLFLQKYLFSVSSLPFTPLPLTKTEGNQHSNKFS